MKRLVLMAWVLAWLTASIASAADAVTTHEDSTRAAQAGAESGALETSITQLSANTNTGPEVPMLRDTNRAAPPTFRVERTAPAAEQRRNPLWLILAVLAVFAARFGLKRWLSRSRPTP